MKGFKAFLGFEGVGLEAIFAKVKEKVRTA